MSECSLKRRKPRRVIRPKGSPSSAPSNSISTDAKQLSLIKRAAKKLKVSNVYNRIAPSINAGSFLANSPGNQRTYKGRVWKLVLITNPKTRRKTIAVLKPNLNASLPIWLLKNNNKEGTKTINYIQNLKRNASNSNIMSLAANKANKAANVIKKKVKSYKKKKSVSAKKSKPAKMARK